MFEGSRQLVCRAVEDGGAGFRGGRLSVASPRFVDRSWESPTRERGNAGRGPRSPLAHASGFLVPCSRGGFSESGDGWL
jgi:hypothetical protein